MKRLILLLAAAGNFLPAPATTIDTTGWDATFRAASNRAMAEALKKTEHQRNQAYENLSEIRAIVDTLHHRSLIITAPLLRPVGGGQRGHEVGHGDGGSDRHGGDRETDAGADRRKADGYTDCLPNWRYGACSRADLAVSIPGLTLYPRGERLPCFGG